MIPIIPKINPREMEKMMKKMGIKSENIEADEVVIRCADKEIVIINPVIQKVNMMGNDSFQISGEISERSVEEEKPKYTEDDIMMVVEQTKCSKAEAKDALEETEGDIAEAILLLNKK